MAQAYDDAMTSDDRDERRTTLRLTVGQLSWIRTRAAEQRCTQNDVIEQALIRAGAPPADPAAAD